MSTLNIFDELATPLKSTDDPKLITEWLHEAGVRFEQWQTPATLQPGADPDRVLAAYADDIQRLVDEGSYQSVDVISVNADNPEVASLRRKFLDEHRHSEDEVRFFVGGRGLFALHIDTKVYEILCEKGDLLSVPAGTPHWFDMGPAPELIAIRFFNNPEGWVANYSGSNIAERFSRLEA